MIGILVLSVVLGAVLAPWPILIASEIIEDVRSGRDLRARRESKPRVVLPRAVVKRTWRDRVRGNT